MARCSAQNPFAPSLKVPIEKSLMEQPETAGCAIAAF
jgi:hypothetical protein